MTTITLQDAQAQLAELIHQLTPGDAITITETETPVAQLVRIPVMVERPPRPRPPVTGIPKAGRWQGKLIVPPNFKEPLEELREEHEQEFKNTKPFSDKSVPFALRCPEAWARSKPVLSDPRRGRKCSPSGESSAEGTTLGMKVGFDRQKNRPRRPLFPTPYAPAATWVVSLKMDGITDWDEVKKLVRGGVQTSRPEARLPAC